jgi:hypothetical protein
MVSAELLGNGARLADGPDLEHGVLGLLVTEFELEDDILTKKTKIGYMCRETETKGYSEGIVASGGDVSDLAASLGGDHDTMGNEIVLNDLAEDVAARDEVADLKKAVKG